MFSNTNFAVAQYGIPNWQCIHFFNVHLAHGDVDVRRDQLKFLRETILNEVIQCGSIIVAGDLNIGASLRNIPDTKKDIETVIENLLVLARFLVRIDAYLTYAC